MLLETNSRFDFRDVEEMKLLSTVESILEGSAVGSVTENGISVVRPTAGSNEAFAGVCINRLKFPTFRVIVETLSVAALTATLSFTPQSSTEILIKNAAGVALVAGDPAVAAGNYSITGNVLTLNSALNDTNITVTYKKTLTVLEAERFWGHGVQIAPRESSALTGSVSVLRRGKVFLDNFNAASDWAAGGVVYAAANGIFTKTNTGIVVPSARILNVPSTDVPFLGLEFAAY